MDGRIVRRKAAHQGCSSRSAEATQCAAGHVRPLVLSRGACRPDDEEAEEGGRLGIRERKGTRAASRRSHRPGQQGQQSQKRGGGSGDDLKDSEVALSSPFLQQSSKASSTPSVLQDFDAKAIQPTTEKKRLAFLARREFLLSIGRELSGARELEHILKDGVHRAAQLTHDRGSFFLVDSEREVMWTIVAEGMGLHASSYPEQGLAGACRVSRAPVITRDVDHDKRGNMSKDVDHTSGYHTKSMLCVPVTHEDGTVIPIQMINKLVPTGPQHPWPKAQNYVLDDEDLHLLEDFAVHLSLALSRLNDLGKHTVHGARVLFIAEG